MASRDIVRLSLECKVLSMESTTKTALLTQRVAGKSGVSTNAVKAGVLAQVRSERLPLQYTAVAAKKVPIRIASAAQSRGKPVRGECRYKLLGLEGHFDHLGAQVTRSKQMKSIARGAGTILDIAGASARQCSLVTHRSSKKKSVSGTFADDMATLGGDFFTAIRTVTRR